MEINEDRQQVYASLLKSSRSLREEAGLNFRTEARWQEARHILNKYWDDQWVKYWKDKCDPEFMQSVGADNSPERVDPASKTSKRKRQQSREDPE